MKIAKMIDNVKNNRVVVYSIQVGADDVMFVTVVGNIKIEHDVFGMLEALFQAANVDFKF